MRFMIRLLTLMLPMVIATPAESGWNPFAEDQVDAVNQDEMSATINAFKSANPALQTFFDKAAGYAVFPNVGKGGIGIGGAYGTGAVYRGSILIGSSSLTQVTIGFQLGGQTYREIIFFRDEQALARFTEGNFELGAQASATALTVGKSVNADYSDGVAIFTLPNGGLMYEASVGGQKFSFTRVTQEIRKPE
ncbi:MAG: lipid-binding SYLF domain-containing protein [Magnetococcus sp. WYHC-3]